MSYSILDTKKLQSLLERCKELEKQARESVPLREGFVLRSACADTLVARKIKLKYLQNKKLQRARQYSTLEKTAKSGRPRQSATFRNRFGRKACRLRKVRNRQLTHYEMFTEIVYTCIPTFVGCSIELFPHHGLHHPYS